MDSIEQIIKSDKLIIFAGSGVSKSINLPDWKKMVIDVITEIDDEKLTPFVPLLENNIMSSLDVLDHLKNHKKTLYDYIDKKFILDDSSFENLILHQKLLELSSNKIITTNYDNAFEIASKRKIISSKPTSKYTINDINKNKKEFIFKIHGSSEEPDNCILFKDDYINLYASESDQAAPEKLKSLFSDFTFLFIGFGFNDPDIELIFRKIDKVFGGLNKHFILTPEAEKFKKFNFLIPIDILKYDLLQSKIDELLKFKKDEIIIRGNEVTINENLRIAVLYPDNLDQEFSNDYINSINQLNDINAELFIGSLNLKTLNRVDDFDLVIILSNVYKEKIYIEENNLKSNLISLDEICENLANPNIPILLLTNEEVNIHKVNYSIINIFKYKNQIIKRFLHKIINDKTFKFNETSIKSNSKLWALNIEKGKSIRKNFYGNDRNLEIGKKCLTNVIGRIEEQSNLTTRLLLLNNSNRILNVKASGGLGKTTLTKKIAYELYNRGYYTKGVNFKSCENIKSYEDFEEILIEGFNLKGILNFKEYLIDNFSNEKIDLLLILDNFETIVNNLSENEYFNVIDTLEFVSDFSNIVITSREKITNKDFEDIFTLTQMITDDAVELFKNNFKVSKSFTLEEIKILREEILEDLLANNPLAIKLVTSSLPLMRIEVLRDQLKDHFFESINNEYTEVFKSNADLNIERTKSIFQSINYSYSTLNSKQRLAFELLSLFPDGIDLNDFKKCFQKNKNSNKITDSEIRLLENKSLVENYNGVLQLQPIIRRFADFQFLKQKDKQKYCTYAYEYNSYFLEFINLVNRKKNSTIAYHLFSKYKNNLLKVLDYIPSIEVSNSKDSIIDNKQYFLNFIYNMDDYLTNKKDINFFQSRTIELIPFFSEIEESENLIKVINLKLDYYHNEFDSSYSELNEMFSIDNMKTRDLNEENEVETKWKNLISIIHSMEGFSILEIENSIKHQLYDRNFFSEYFYLGINNLKFVKKEIGFYYFENLFRNNQLNVDELKVYIKSLFMEQHLEIMQCTYTLSKFEKISSKNIKKLVVTNPYTKGLKYLMLAFNSDLIEDKNNFYKKAIKNLHHIKYYYLEALYYYSKFLKENNYDEFKLNLSEGLRLSKKYKYQYLDYLFSNLEKDTNENYNFNYDYFSINGLEEYVNKDIDEWIKIEI